MTLDEFSQVVSDQATKTYNSNIEYIKSHHSEELDSLAKENPDASVEAVVVRILTSYLRTSIELSTVNTISVLQNLGVVPPLSTLPLAKQED